jgi:acetyl/propionyl-CoA carboxylase alpha subunit
VRHPGFAKEQPTTEFFGKHMDGILRSLVPEPLSTVNPHLVMGLSTYVESFRPKVSVSNWDGNNEFSFWRASRAVNQKFSLEMGDEKLDVAGHISGSNFSFTSVQKDPIENVTKNAKFLSSELIVERLSDQNVSCSVYSAKIELDGKLLHGTVSIQTPPKGNSTTIDIWLHGQTGEHSTHYQFKIQSPLANAASKGVSLNPVVLSPMPGKIVKINVQDGARVKKGEPVLILEAMKMEHVVSAPCDG